MAQPWFSLLSERCANSTRLNVSVMLGISPAALSQVLNGSGKYGTGEAKTDRIADRVLHTFGRYVCPHLTEQAEVGEEVVITADQCRVYAHRGAPIGSPRELQHWQSCQKCPHKDASAPPQPREVKPRQPAENGGHQ
jgi:hypothetical protein